MVSAQDIRSRNVDRLVIQFSFLIDNHHTSVFKIDNLNVATNYTLHLIKFKSFAVLRCVVLCLLVGVDNLCGLGFSWLLVRLWLLWLLIVIDFLSIGIFNLWLLCRFITAMLFQFDRLGNIVTDGNPPSCPNQLWQVII